MSLVAPSLPSALEDAHRRLSELADGIQLMIDREFGKAAPERVTTRKLSRGEDAVIQRLLGGAQRVFDDHSLSAREMCRLTLGAIEMLEGKHHVVCGPPPANVDTNASGERT